MRRLGLAVLMASTAGLGTAWADDAYIQLEAWREPAEAAAKAQGWAARFPETVTWQSGRWFAIGLGPIEGDAAARMGELKAERAIPRDAYLVTLGDDVTVSPVIAGDGAGTGPAATDEPADATDETNRPDAAAEMAGPETATEPADDTTGAGTTEAATEAAGAATEPAGAATAPDAPPAEPAPVSETHIRLEAFQSRADAEAALTRWREVLPGAALWQLSSGWFAIAAGPLDPAVAGDWLAAWKAADAIPADAFATTEAELGTLLTAGAPPDPDAVPPAPEVMPPVEVVQEALHWAGRYEGEIDGRPGPQTNAAIAAEMEAQGIAPGTRNGEAIAMQALLARRDAWQGEMGLAPLTDALTGLTLTVPLDRLDFLREDRGLSIYGPKDESGAALILFNQPGGRAEMEDLAGLITALGWVGHPERQITASAFTLNGGNATHIGHAEGRIVDGQLRGFVLIWPAADAENAPRLAAVASETLELAPVDESTEEPEAEAAAD